jgi:hypothetical protein
VGVNSCWDEVYQIYIIEEAVRQLTNIEEKLGERTLNITSIIMIVMDLIDQDRGIIEPHIIVVSSLRALDKDSTFQLSEIIEIQTKKAIII